MAVFFLACKQIERLEDFPANFWNEPPEKTFLATGNEFCPRITLGLHEGWVYRCERERLFNVAEQETDLDARLEKLATLVGFNRQIHGIGCAGPFYELFRYTPYFGTIGPVVSSKLANNFAWVDERARALGDIGFYAWFNQMREMFQFAGEHGAVWCVDKCKHSKTLARLTSEDGVIARLHERMRDESERIARAARESGLSLSVKTTP
jgi:hypothetical protein